MVQSWLLIVFFLWRLTVALVSSSCWGILIYSLWMPLNLPIKGRHHRFLVPASSWPFPPQIWSHIVLTKPKKIKLIVHVLCHTIYILHCKSFHLSPLFRDGILEQHFLSRFLDIKSRLEFSSDFLPSLFHASKCYSWKDSSFQLWIF